MPYPHNDEGAAPSDWTAVYAHLMLQRERRIRAEKDGLKALAAEASQNGVDLRVVKEAFRFQDETPEQREARINKLHNTLKALHTPGVQLDFFDVFEPARRPSEDEAFDRGFQAGVFDHQPVPPYDDGSSEGQAWLRGYHEFRAQLSEYHKRFETKEDADGEPNPWG